MYSKLNNLKVHLFKFKNNKYKLNLKICKLLICLFTYINEIIVSAKYQQTAFYILLDRVSRLPF